MGKFKRFCMIVFVVAAVLGIGVLAALWFAWEPLFPAIAWLMSMPWFFVVEAVLLGITALGLLVVLIRAITAPGKNSQLELERDNGSIAITQNAIQSTVKHVVESHHGLSTDNVKVHITNKHDPRMSIHAKIDPGRNAELGQLGAKLQDEIAMALVKAQVGQTVKVLVEGFGRNEGTLSGRLDNNLTVEFTADASLMGSYANVHLTGARATVLLGELA